MDDGLQRGKIQKWGNRMLFYLFRREMRNYVLDWDSGNWDVKLQVNLGGRINRFDSWVWSECYEFLV